MYKNKPRKQALSCSSWWICFSLAEDTLPETEVLVPSDDFTKLLPAIPARKDVTQALEICHVRLNIPSRWCEGVIGRDDMTELPAMWSPVARGKSLWRKEGFRIHGGILSGNFFFLLVSTSNLSPMSFLTENKTFLDMKSFLEQSQVIGVALGFMTASATLDLSRSVVSELLYPWVIAIRTASLPRFDLDDVAQSLITWILSMFVVFILIKGFNLQEKKIPMVLAVSAGGMA
jgi:large-conductance mechanosensitive channel